ncbi:hypothetical protein [Duganella margarita]|uniref:hypothetical protein n=1 Tax=Duganella margarita TaxID=2692170 RepID=UPI001927D7C6
MADTEAVGGTASQEQSLGIEQVNQAIIQMDGVTQQNAALVEESAAVAESLQDQAVALSNVAGKFVLNQNGMTNHSARPLLVPTQQLKAVGVKKTSRGANQSSSLSANASGIKSKARAEKDWVEF